MAEIDEHIWQVEEERVTACPSGFKLRNAAWIRLGPDFAKFHNDERERIIKGRPLGVEHPHN